MRHLRPDGKVLAAGLGLAGLGLAALGLAFGRLGATWLRGALGMSAAVVLEVTGHVGVPRAGEEALRLATIRAPGSVLPLLATGALLAGVFALRASRARSGREWLVHLGVAFASGFAASWGAAHHAGGMSTLWLGAVGLAAVLASVPWIVPPGTVRTRRLLGLARQVRGARRVGLLRAAVLHRRLAARGLGVEDRETLATCVDELAEQARGGRPELAAGRLRQLYETLTPRSSPNTGAVPRR